MFGSQNDSESTVIDASDNQQSRKNKERELLIKLLHNRCILHPAEPLHRVWDIISTIALVVACIITPWQLAFYTHLSDHQVPSLIGILNVLVDILFAIEIVIFFNTSYYDSES